MGRQLTDRIEALWIPQVVSSLCFSSDTFASGHSGIRLDISYLNDNRETLSQEDLVMARTLRNYADNLYNLGSKTHFHKKHYQKRSPPQIALMKGRVSSADYFAPDKRSKKSMGSFEMEINFYAQTRNNERNEFLIESVLPRNEVNKLLKRSNCERFGEMVDEEVAMVMASNPAYFPSDEILRYEPMVISPAKGWDQKLARVPTRG